MIENASSWRKIWSYCSPSTNQMMKFVYPEHVYLKAFSALSTKIHAYAVYIWLHFTIVGAYFTATGCINARSHQKIRRHSAELFCWVVAFGVKLWIRQRSDPSQLNWVRPVFAWHCVCNSEQCQFCLVELNRIVSIFTPSDWVQLWPLSVVTQFCSDWCCHWLWVVD